MSPLVEPVSILMPVCDEADIIRDVIREWIEKVISRLPAGSELVLDDASADGTHEILLALAREHTAIRVQHRDGRDGFFAAAQRLYRAARCPLVFFTDSDGQYVPEEFWRVAEHIRDHDIVHGAKVSRKDPLYRVIASGAFNRLFRLVMGSRLKDVNSAFRLARREVIERLLPDVRHMPVLLNAELLIRAESAGLRIRLVEVEHRPRRFGKSRGLPLRSFLRECWRAWKGLLALRRELRAIGT